MHMAYKTVMKQILRISTFLVCSLCVSWATGGSAAKDPPARVESVTLSQYLGKWYELSRIPNSFQDNKKGDFGECFNTVAEYSERPNGKLNVINTGIRYNAKNEEMSDVAKAKAEVVKGSNNAKLKVNFTGIDFLDWIGIGDGDYWILGLGPVNSEGLYSWAFVGAPKRNFGWILSRTRTLPQSEIKKIQDLIKEKGYSTESFKSFLN